MKRVLSYMKVIFLRLDFFQGFIFSEILPVRIFLIFRKNFATSQHISTITKSNQVKAQMVALEVHFSKIIICNNKSKKYFHSQNEIFSQFFAL